MRELSLHEACQVSGGDAEYSYSGDSSSGHATVGDNSLGYSVTASYQNMGDLGTDINLSVSFAGISFNYQTNSAQELGSFVLGSGVAAAVLAYGGSATLAAAVAMGAKWGYKKLWRSNGKELPREMAPKY